MSHRSPADSPSDPSSPSNNHPRGLLRSLKRFLPVSSRSFHGYEGEFRDRFDQIMRAVSDQTGMIRDLQRRLDESQAQVRDLQGQVAQTRDRLGDLQEKHDYEEDRQMMLFWSLWREPGESEEEAKLRFFRGLPQATGVDRLYQRAEIKLFKAFIDICEENHILYWAIAGTLLGAYRHGDMIPWDDDIDVLIPRDELKRLMTIISEDPRYKNDYRITELWDWFVICRQIRFRLQDDDNPIFVDLFPLDWSSGDATADYNTNQDIRHRFYDACRATFAGTEWERRPYLPVSDPFASHVDRLFDRFYQQSVSASHIIPSRDGATGLLNSMENLDERHPSGPYPIADWLPTTTMTFAGFPMAVNPGWRTYLTNMYGDYLAIPRDIHSHNHVDKSLVYSDKTIRILKAYVGD